VHEPSNNQMQLMVPRGGILTVGHRVRIRAPAPHLIWVLDTRS